MYSIKEGNKELRLTFGGRFTSEEAKNFIKDYTTIKTKIDKKNTNLILDCKELRCSNQETLPMLSQCLEMYKNDGYKKITMIEMEDKIAKMQMSRIQKEFMNSIEFI